MKVAPSLVSCTNCGKPSVLVHLPTGQIFGPICHSCLCEAHRLACDYADQAEMSAQKPPIPDHWHCPRCGQLTNINTTCSRCGNFLMVRTPQSYRESNHTL